MGWGHRSQDPGNTGGGHGCRHQHFYAKTVNDNDNWAKPHQYATGFHYVIIGGTAVIDKGAMTGAFPGRVLKKSDS
jgi:hypothetical protein